MIVPEFIQFYGYTASQALNEYAVTFFALVNDMYRLRAQNMLENITANNADEDIYNHYRRYTKGLSGILKEARIINGKH